MPVNICPTLKPYHLFLLVFICLCTLNGLIISIFGIKQTLTSSKNMTIKIPTKIKILYITATLFCNFASIGRMAHVSNAFSQTCANKIAFHLSGLPGLSSYFIALSLIYLTFLERLHVLFMSHKLKHLALNKLLYYFLLFSVPLNLTAAFCAPYGFARGNWSLGNFGMSLFLWAYTAFNILLCILFVRKLHQLKGEISKYNQYNEVHTEQSQTTQLESITTTEPSRAPTQTLPKLKPVSSNVKPFIKSITDLAIKITICVMVTFFSTTLVNAFALYRAFVDDSTDLWLTHLSLIPFDSFINCLCLYLQFTFGTGLYTKLCKPLTHIFQHIVNV
eukprot:104024_1